MSEDRNKLGRIRDRGPEEAVRILVVDDDDMLRGLFSRLLGRQGWTVVTSPHGHDAIAKLIENEFDVLISDVQMPDMSGIELLRQVRSHDLELPVILVTGAPTLATAAEAVSYGATKYLTKPVDNETLVDAVARAAKLRRFAQLKRKAMTLAGTDGAAAGDRAGAEVQFARALDSLWMAYQPIVSATDGSVFAYEALLRSDEPGLPHPGAVLDAAERLDKVHELGRVVRERAAAPISEAGNGPLLFVNLHPGELSDPDLLAGGSALGSIASRVVLEITERASLESIPKVGDTVAKLRELGFRVAIDDLGAGYAGLSSFAQLEPEFVKLDMSLVRDVETSRTRQKVIRSIAGMCADLDMQVVAEGIETAIERDTLIELGCSLLQGYRFARPGRPFPDVDW